MKLRTAIICITSLLAAACSDISTHTHKTARSLEPERRSTEAEIRQHIVGRWTLANGSDVRGSETMIVAEDGNLIEVQSNGKKEMVGAWELCGTLLRVTVTRSRLEAAHRSGYHMNDWDYYPIIYADDRELVMAPGISVAGRLRYKRFEPAGGGKER